MELSARLFQLGLCAALVAAAFAVPGADAGTQAAPEITDAPNDQTLGPTPVCPAPPNVCQFTNADLLAAWIDNDTVESLQVHILISGTGPSSTTEYTYSFNLEIDGTAYQVGAVLHRANTQGGLLGDGGIVPMGAASNVTFTSTPDGGLMTMFVPKELIGNPVPGANATNIFVTAVGVVITDPLNLVADRAPDAGSVNYTFGGAPIDPADIDADGLNDTWEQDHFGDLSEEGSGDPDGDDLNNTEEFDAGTDPTVADSDGDTVPDGTEVADGTDPLDPDTDGDGLDDGEESGQGTDPTEADSDGDGFPDGQEVDEGTDPLDEDDFPEGTPSTTPPSTSPGPTSSTGNDDAESDSIADKLKDNLDYAGISAAALVACLVLCIIALAGRWGL